MNGMRHKDGTKTEPGSISVAVCDSSSIFQQYLFAVCSNIVAYVFYATLFFNSKVQLPFLFSAAIILLFHSLSRGFVQPEESVWTCVKH